MFSSGYGNRPDIPNIAVLITDGSSNNPELTFEEAVRVRSRGITLMGIGIGQDANVEELEGIASFPVSANVMMIDDFDNLTTLHANLSLSLCNEVNECLSNPCQNAGRCVDLINGFQCVCSNNFTGALCERDCSGKVDLALIIDASANARQERFPKILLYLSDLIQSIEVSPVKTRVSVVVYSDNATVQFHLTNYSNSYDVMKAIHNIEYMGGKSDLASAIRLMIDSAFVATNGDRQDVPDVAIILTAGKSNLNSDQTVQAAIEARNHGVFMIVIGVGGFYDMHELRAIASEPVEETLYSVDSWKLLPSISDAVLEAICPVFNSCDSNPCKNRGQCVEDFKQHVCICEPGTSGLFCERSCSRQMDITLILDLSGSNEDYRELVVEFSRQVAGSLPIGSFARLAVVTYSDKAWVKFYLNTYSSVASVLNAMVFVPVGGTTNTQEALHLTHEEVFTVARGDRSGVDNIAILLTDGHSNVQQENTQTEGDAMRKKGVEVYVAAIGDQPDMVEVSGLASEPKNSHVVLVSDAQDVNKAADVLLDSLCGR